MEYWYAWMGITALFGCVMLAPVLIEFRQKHYLLAAKTAILFAACAASASLQKILYIRVWIWACVYAALAGHLILGNALYYYLRFRHFDRYQHALGTFSFTLFGSAWLQMFLFRYSVYTLPKWFESVSVVTLGISLGCLFELYEFVIDSITHAGHQHGLKDTNIDLVADVAGAVCAGIISILTRLWV